MIIVSDPQIGQLYEDGTADVTVTVSLVDDQNPDLVLDSAMTSIRLKLVDAKSQYQKVIAILTDQVTAGGKARKDLLTALTS